MKLFGALAWLVGVTAVVGPGFAADDAVRTVSVRDFGAIGDGRVHSVREWVQSGRFASLRALRAQLPFVTDERWSVDEAAFELAQRALPPTGGTISFPAGCYVATASAWTVRRDGVRLAGAGAEQTILATGAAVGDGLVLSGYRHVGWSKTYPFASEDGAVGADSVRLRDANGATEFQPGQLVFVRNGANRFDQDYGEFNEVKSVGSDGQIRLTHPLARDYTLAALNWSGKIAVEFGLPKSGGTVRVEFSREPGCVLPAAGDNLSLGENIFRVDSITPPSTVRLSALGRTHAAPGSRVPAGTLVATERGLVRLTASTRGFRCANLTVRGRRKALVLSNSYDSAFSDCVFERVPGDAAVSGGIVIDGDDGRFARFVRCTVRADPPCGMQFARSFGGVSFDDCHFVNTNVAFTEFNFDCAVTHCTFDLTGGPALRSAIIVGKSCDNLRILGNVIKARNLQSVFDEPTDIQSFKQRGAGEIVIQDNVVEVDGVDRVFALDHSVVTRISGNTVRGRFGAMGANDGVNQPRAK